jgi:hypothetical protein
MLIHLFTNEKKLLLFNSKYYMKATVIIALLFISVSIFTQEFNLKQNDEKANGEILMDFVILNVK